MAITTYAELQSAVSNWLGRSSNDPSSTRLTEFIALAEADINTRLRTIDMETKTTSFSINAEYVNVPTNFLAVRSFETTFGGQRYPITPMPDELQSELYTSSGPPQYHEVVGSQFRFAPVPDATYTATLVYYLKLPALSGSVTSNWLLASHPDVYLYGALTQATAYAKDEPRAQGWAQMYLEGIDRLKKHNDRNRWGGGALQMRAVGMATP